MAGNHYTPAAPGDFFCPTGGTWYACQTGTKFVGCCTSDPCMTGCSGDRLRPAGVSPAIYNQYPGGSCNGNTLFWTCSAGPTFWGCCKSDPCAKNSACAAGDLEPTFMTGVDQIKYFGALNARLSSTATPGISVSSTSSSAPATSSSAYTVTVNITSTSSTRETVSSSSIASNHSPTFKISGAVIAGIVGGAVAFLGFLGVIVAVLYYKRKKKRRQKDQGGEAENQDATMPTTEKYFHGHGISPHFNGLSPPPTYSHKHPTFFPPSGELPAESINPYTVDRCSELPA